MTIEAQNTPVAEASPQEGSFDVMSVLEASISPEEATALQAEFGAGDGTGAVPPPPAPETSPAPVAAPAPFDPREMFAQFQAQAEQSRSAYEQLVAIEREKAAEATRRFEELARPKREPRKEDPTVAEFRQSIFDDLNDHPVVKEAREAKSKAEATQARLDQMLQQQNYAAMKASAESAVNDVFLKDLSSHLEPAEAQKVRPLLKELSYAAALTLGQATQTYVSPMDAAAPLAEAINILVNARMKAYNAKAKASVQARASAPQAVATIGTEPAAGSGRAGFKPTREQLNQYYGGDSWAAAMDAEAGYPRIPR